MSAIQTDLLEIVNGPEDGAAFPITRTPAAIGASVDCAVFITFDKSVQPLHARLSVVSGGYRVRAVSSAPVYVNKKRSGAIWARVARPGDIVRVGDTKLCLACAPDGLAKRSIGMPTEGNIAWLFRALFRVFGKGLGLLYRPLYFLLTRVNRLALAVLVALVVLALFRPGYLQLLATFIGNWTRYLLWRVWSLF